MGGEPPTGNATRWNTETHVEDADASRHVSPKKNSLLQNRFLTQTRFTEHDEHAWRDEEECARTLFFHLLTRAKIAVLIGCSDSLFQLVM
jgi:hypothetical protein